MDDKKNNKTTAVDTTLMTDRQKHDVAEMSNFTTKDQMTDYFVSQLNSIEPPTTAAYTARFEELKNMATEAEKYELVNSADISEKTEENLQNRRDSDSKIVQDVLGALGQIFGLAAPLLAMAVGGASPLLNPLTGIYISDTNNIGSSGVSGSNHSQNNGMGI